MWEGPWTITKEAAIDRSGAFHLFYDEASGRSYRLDGRLADEGGAHELQVNASYTLTWRVSYGGNASSIEELEGALPLNAR